VVLGERNIAHSEDDDLPKLFKKASQSLPFLPPEASGEGEIRKSLVQTLSGLAYRYPRDLRATQPVRLRIARLGARARRWSRAGVARG